MLQTTRNSPLPELSVWAPLILAILRIVSALLVFAGAYGAWTAGSTHDLDTIQRNTIHD
jgi:hypothetical protein